MARSGRVPCDNGSLPVTRLATSRAKAREPWRFPGDRPKAWVQTVRMQTGWLGEKDSNLRSRNQNPLPYRLATPHQLRQPSAERRAGSRTPTGNTSAATSTSSTRRRSTLHPSRAGASGSGPRAWKSSWPRRSRPGSRAARSSPRAWSANRACSCRGAPGRAGRSTSSRRSLVMRRLGSVAAEVVRNLPAPSVQTESPAPTAGDAGH